MELTITIEKAGQIIEALETSPYFDISFVKDETLYGKSYRVYEFDPALTVKQGFNFNTTDKIGSLASGDVLEFPAWFGYIGSSYGGSIMTAFNCSGNCFSVDTINYDYYVIRSVSPDGISIIDNGDASSYLDMKKDFVVYLPKNLIDKNGRLLSYTSFKV